MIPFAVHFANFSDDPKDLFESSHPFRTALHYILESRGWSQDINVIISAGVSQDKKERLMESFKQDPLVAKMESSKTISDYFARNLNPLDQALVKRDLEASSVFNHFEAKNGDSRVVLFIKDTDQKTVLGFKKRIEDQCPKQECYVTGPIDLYHEFVFQVSRTLTESLAVSLGIVALILMALIRVRKVPFGFALMASSLWGPCFMLVLLSVTQVSINAFTSSFAAIMVGLAGDNAIQFMFAYRKSDFLGRMRTRGNGAFFTCAVMAACSLTFLGSVYRPPKVMGALLFLGFLLNFFGDYAILEGLIQSSKQGSPQLRE